jgi:predicted alpha/beta superfamily hydrolase
MKSFFTFLVAAAFILGNAANATAQSVSKPVVIGEELTLYSSVLKEERVLFISKPLNYETSTERYPVLFLLDGGAHFHHTTATTRFLARNQFAPEMLVVAIGNTDRTRDLTPPSQDPAVARIAPTQGGAAGFQTFIADELVPWLDKNYRTRPFRVLVGHSYGGLFAIHSLITRPDLFNAYIAISPSLQWDSQQVVKRAQEFFARTDKLNVSLYITSGNEGGDLVGGIRKLTGVLQERTLDGFSWHFEPMPLESHGSVPNRSTYEGLEFVFADWTLRDPFETYNKYGIEGVENFFAASEKKYGMGRAVRDRVTPRIALELESAGRLDEIMALLSRNVFRFGANSVQPPASYLVRIADQYLAKGRTEKAVEVYQLALKAEPGNDAAKQALTKLGIELSNPATR